MLKPQPLRRVRELGLLVFGAPWSANLVVERGPGKPDEWDGLLHLAYLPGEGAGWLFRSWPAATRPGTPYLKRHMNPKGTGMLAGNVQNRRSHARGLHRGQPALVQVGRVLVRRDGDRDELLEPGETVESYGDGFNIHSIYHPRELAGCIGLAPLHMDELLAEYDKLVPHQGRLVSLTVFEG